MTSPGDTVSRCRLLLYSVICSSMVNRKPPAKTLEGFAYSYMTPYEAIVMVGLRVFGESKSYLNSFDVILSYFV